jgi:hypothetical protein
MPLAATAVSTARRRCLSHPALADSVLARLAVEPGLFHRGAGGEPLWRGLTEAPLSALAATIREGMRTLETGCGGTTVVFAACGARHTAITPSSAEERRVRDFCAAEGIRLDEVDFRIGSSDALLVAWDEPLDLILIDGAHRFPFPILDWHFGASQLRIGGQLWLDDVPIPAVHQLFQFLRGEPEWELLAIHDDKVAQFRKVAEPLVDATRDWELQSYNEPWKWSFTHIPLHRRWRKARQRLMLRSRLRARLNRERAASL